MLWEGTRESKEHRDQAPGRRVSKKNYKEGAGGARAGCYQRISFSIEKRGDLRYDKSTSVARDGVVRLMPQCNIIIYAYPHFLTCVCVSVGAEFLLVGVEKSLLFRRCKGVAGARKQAGPAAAPPARQPPPAAGA